MNKFLTVLMTGLIATSISAGAFAAQQSKTPSAPNAKVAATKAATPKAVAQNHLVSKKHMANKKLNEKKA